MVLLLTNDDGIYAPGLKALWQELGKTAQVVVVAPESEQSAVGHAITLSHPLRVKQVNLDGLTGWAVNGTPADCVKIALAELLPAPPDLVVSGINLGANVGINVLYSGTVSAATEAAILGCRAVAVSLNTYREGDFVPAARITSELIGRLKHWSWPPKVCLNINLPCLPPESIKGVRITRQDTGTLVERFDRRVDPRERVYYWLAGINASQDPEAGTDYHALMEGYISITPIHHDLTSYPALETLAGLSWP